MNPGVLWFDKLVELWNREMIYQIRTKILKKEKIVKHLQNFRYNLRLCTDTYMRAHTSAFLTCVNAYAHGQLHEISRVHWRTHACTNALRQNEKRRRTVVRRAKNEDVSTWRLAGPFARSPAPFAPLTHTLVSRCLLSSRTPLRLFICSLAHFSHFSWERVWFMSQN